jgi:hypothetical protein
VNVIVFGEVKHVSKKVPARVINGDVNSENSENFKSQFF